MLNTAAPSCRLATLLCVFSIGITAARAGELFVANAADVAQAAAKLRAGDPRLERALETVVAEAEQALKVPVVTVAAKAPDRSPSGDPHDYVSLSPYWWPNPETENGLPYIRRDGEFNPERDEYDVSKLSAFTVAVRWLAFAYRFTGDEKYAEAAAEHLRAWFIDPETRMNPNLQYGQFIPGRNEGRSYGIIETNRFRWIPDAIGMLAGSEHWSSADTAATKVWFGEYLDWLLTSDHGKKERRAPNNHGTYYAAQVMLYALFTGRDALVREMAQALQERIEWQIEMDGAQPLEHARTNGVGYSDFNIRGMVDAANYAKRVGIDLFGFETEDGASIRKAQDYILPYLIGEKDWHLEQINPHNYDRYAQGLRRAARGFDEPRYERAIRKLPVDEEGILWLDLVLPPKHDVGG